MTYKMRKLGISLAVQWLRLCTSTAGGVSSIPGLLTKIPACQKKKKEKNQSTEASTEVTQTLELIADKEIKTVIIPVFYTQKNYVEI